MADVIGGDKLDVVYLCPECGSAALEYPESYNTTASCNACGWCGKQTEMLVAPIVHMEGSKENIASRLSNDLRAIFTKSFAKPYSEFLMRWGFITQESLNKESLGRYFAAAAVAVLEATIRERQRREKERVSGTN